VARQSCAKPPSTATSLAVMKLLSDDARKAAAAPSSAGSPMRWNSVIEPCRLQNVCDVAPFLKLKMKGDFAILLLSTSAAYRRTRPRWRGRSPKQSKPAHF
jgi:hypothetical protein